MYTIWVWLKPYAYNVNLCIARSTKEQDIVYLTYLTFPFTCFHQPHLMIGITTQNKEPQNVWRKDKNWLSYLFFGVITHLYIYIQLHSLKFEEDKIFVMRMKLTRNMPRPINKLKNNILELNVVGTLLLCQRCLTQHKGDQSNWNTTSLDTTECPQHVFKKGCKNVEGLMLDDGENKQKPFLSVDLMVLILIKELIYTLCITQFCQQKRIYASQL